MMKIKRDDEVIVIAGKDKGKRGKVIQVLDNGKMLVAGVNMVKKHQKPNPQKGIQGGIVEQEAAIQASNIGIFNPETEKADGVSIKVDGENKIRVFKSNGQPLDA